MAQKFIVTTDKSIADKLTTLGFRILSTNGSSYVFLNNPPKNFSFSSIDSTKCYFTNILSM